MAKDQVLDREILRLSENDVIRFRDIIEGGCFVSGGLGAGKSSTILFLLAMSAMYAGLGMLVLTVKSDETERFIRYARAAGRGDDLIIFNAHSGLSFDPLAFIWKTGGRAAALIEGIVEIFTVLMSVGKPHSQSIGERYFELAVEELVRASLVILSNAGEPISITSLHRLISSLPTEKEQITSPEWQKTSECGRVIQELRSRRETFTESQRDDLDIAMVYLLEKWPDLDPRTRGNIESTWSGLASKFLYDPFRSMFCSGRFDFSPDQITHEKKILIIDVPSLEFGRETSRIFQILIKLVFQRACLRHQYVPGCCNGAVLFQDEFPFLMHRNESQFHTVCRSSAIAPICACQNILTLAAEEFGEQTPGAKTLGFLGLFGAKVFLANNEFRTNEYASDQIGKEYRYVDSWTAGSGADNHHHNGLSGNKQLVHLIEPIEFTKLLRPDGQTKCPKAFATSTAARSTRPKPPTDRKVCRSCAFTFHASRRNHVCFGRVPCRAFARQRDESR